MIAGGRSGRPGLHVAGGTGVFRHRNYRLYFAGQAVSLVGTWMMQVAQAWLVLQLTGDPLWLGVIAAAQYLPVMILAVLAGVYADSFRKRRVLLVTQAVKLVLAFGVAILAITNLATVDALVAIALLTGIVNAIDMPVRHAFVFEMVGREDVGRAVALNSAMFDGARIVGPAIAGLTIGALGVASAFVVDAASFLAVIIALVIMDEAELQSPVRIARPSSLGAVARELGEGLTFVRGTPAVLAGTVVVGLLVMFAMNFQVVIPALADDVLRSGASGFGFLMAATGVGSVLAAVRLAQREGGHIHHIAYGAILLGLAELALAWSRWFPISIVLMVVIGFGAILATATVNTVIQLAAPDSLRGRVMSIYTTMWAVAIPLGGLLMGGLASALGVPTSLAVGGLVAVAVGIGARTWFEREPAAAARERRP